ncbi:PadR family transcriptional regulator [Halegenticoccus soli]|uniref:PadR family transcriptional regulator n=1 Tax=Halegenticoccus soli TaxID=1985678 RepID=UPI000C6D86AD|nr:PadR family transcriptional regulator [Halegenticoccus soli]
MSGDSLESLIESVQDWTESRRDSVRASSAQTALVVSCSMSDCEPREPLWPIDAAWNAVGVQTLGNQTRERYEGETVIDGDIAHLRNQYDIAAVLVVGHTRCEVLRDAYDRWVSPPPESPAGVQARLDPLVSLVEDGAEQGLFEESTSLRTRAYRLVEYNVSRQVRFLQQALPPSVTIAGYVHDQDGAYSSFPGKRYLVALDGATEPTEIRPRLPDDPSVQVGSLLN